MPNPQIMTGGDYFDPFWVIDNQVGSVPLKLTGVGWYEPSFDPYLDMYDGLVSNAKCIVSQFPPDRSEFEIWPDCITENKYPLKYYDSFMNQGVWNLCKKHKKPIYKVDPFSVPLCGVGEVMSFLPILSFVGANLDFINQLFIASDEKQISEKLILKALHRIKITRRKFLHLMIFGLAAYISAGTLPASPFIGSAENSKNEFYREAVFGPNDFRNIAMINGLEKLVELDLPRDGEYILSFPGWTHQRAIDFYLNHRNEANKKLDFYRPTFAKLVECSVKKYEHMGGRWQLADSWPYELESLVG